mgnify:CR=1 FL=1
MLIVLQHQTLRVEEVLVLLVVIDVDLILILFRVLVKDFDIGLGSQNTELYHL